MANNAAEKAAEQAVTKAPRDIYGYPAFPATLNLSGMVTWPDNEEPFITNKL